MAIDFVDDSIGKVVAKLKEKNIYEETLIIIASKHGQAPIDPKKFSEVDPAAVINATKVDVLWQTVSDRYFCPQGMTMLTTAIKADDISLLFLKNHHDTDTAVKNLEKARKELKIDDIIYGERLISENFGNPLTDTAVPDIIIKPMVGVIYTTSNAKIAEHGGLSDDDRHVACIVSNPKLKKTRFTKEVSTKQVGPTILTALGLDPDALEGAKKEGTKPLEGF